MRPARTEGEEQDWVPVDSCESARKQSSKAPGLLETSLLRTAALRFQVKGWDHAAFAEI